MAKTRKRLTASAVLFIALLAASLFLAFFRLGQMPLADFDEATYAAIAQHTLAHGNWMTLQYNGVNWFEKPPLYLWLTALSMKAFGNSEFAARLPAALFTVLAVLFLYLLVRELSDDPWLAYFSALSLLAVQPFFIFAREVRMDVPTIAAILFSLWCFVKGNKPSRGKYLAGVGAGIGIGIMMKSVIGLLAAVPIVIWSLLYRKWDWLKSKYFWIGAALLLAIVLPWHLYEAARYGAAFWQSYFVQQVVNRGTELPGSNPVTAADYLSFLWYEVQPWTIVFLLMISALAFAKRGDPKRKVAAFGFFSTVAILAAFLVARTKIVTYLLPIFPFALIFIGAAIFAAVGRIRGRWKLPILLLVCGGILSIAFWNTARDAFANYPKAFAYLSDEKAVGLVLGTQTGGGSAFIYNAAPGEVIPNNTITFYGGKAVDTITEPQQFPGDHDFLIFPTASLAALAAAKPFHMSMRVLYEGPYLMLVEAD